MQYLGKYMYIVIYRCVLLALNKSKNQVKVLHLSKHVAVIIIKKTPLHMFNKT